MLFNVMAATNTDWLEKFLEEHAKSKIISATAGVLYFAGLWIAIDLCALYSHLPGFHGVYHLCGVFGTLSLIIMNRVSNAMLFGMDAKCRPLAARYWMFLGLFMGFSAILGSLWAMSEYLSLRKDNEPVYPGVGIFIENLLIGASSALMRFGRGEPDDI